MNYSGFWIRFLAYVLDSIITGIGFLGLVMLLSAMGLELVGGELIFLAIGILYWALMHASARQATLGKSLLGLKVGGLNGERITPGRALAREFAKIISTLTFLIGFIIAAFTQRKQAVHDFIASTTVVRAEHGRVALALAVAVLAFVAPVAAVAMLGVGVLGSAATDLTAAFPVQTQTQPVALPTAPKPAAPRPAQKAVVPAEPKVTTVPLVAAPEAAKAAPVVTPVAMPLVVAQAPAPAEKPAEAQPPKQEEKPKPVAQRPAPPPPAAEKEVASAEAPVYTPAARHSGPRFNDLTTAVLYGDTQAVQELLKLGKWADKPDSRGITPLMDAAQLGDAESAEVLLKAGADPNRPGPGGTTAMSIARERDDAGLTGLLGKFGGR